MDDIKPKIVEASNRAEEIARIYNPEGFFPFPYENIQKDKRNLNIFFAEVDDNEVSGVILYNKEKDEFNILVNKKKPPTRQHFTVAHELGHYFLHADIIKSEKIIVDKDNYLDGGQMLYRLDGAERSKIETEANNFAASLIMPEMSVRRAWDAVESVEECAKIFKVSVVAMSIRLERLRLLNN